MTAVKPTPDAAHRRRSASQIVGRYWRDRSDLLYYKYLDYVVRTVAADATSLLDVGSRDCGYLEWFDWIETRVSVDLVKPYQSETVQGLTVDFFDYDPGRRFDVCICSQVMEHVPEVERFAEKLLSVADALIVTVPYRWPPGRAAGHVHDPIDGAKLARWMGREANYQIVIEEPFRRIMGRRLLAYYDVRRPDRRIDAEALKARRPNPFV